MLFQIATTIPLVERLSMVCYLSNAWKMAPPRCPSWSIPPPWTSQKLPISQKLSSGRYTNCHSVTVNSIPLAMNRVGTFANKMFENEIVLVIISMVSFRVTFGLYGCFLCVCVFCFVLFVCLFVVVVVFVLFCFVLFWGGWGGGGGCGGCLFACFFSVDNQRRNKRHSVFKKVLKIIFMSSGGLIFLLCVLAFCLRVPYQYNTKTGFHCTCSFTH